MDRGIQSSLGGISVLVKELLEGQGRERGIINNRETDGEKHDLPRSMFNSEDRERRDKGEVAVIMGKGERINVLTTVKE